MTDGDARNGAADRSALRRELRARRRAIGADERLRLSQAIARHAATWIREHARGDSRVGAFLSLPEEPDTAPLLDALSELDCRILLPRISSFTQRRLVFVESHDSLEPNRYGIDEPAGGTVHPASELDIVFVPLVGFDRRGARLGMGGGYYDRAFAFRARHANRHRPRLIGIAYACLEVDRLPEAPHDIRLDAIVTEHGVLPATGAP